jgi:hypothetical protein
LPSAASPHNPLITPQSIISFAIAAKTKKFIDITCVSPPNHKISVRINATKKKITYMPGQQVPSRTTRQRNSTYPSEG